MLLDEVVAVEEALQRNLEAARLRLRNLVSRPTESLSESEVRESALESLAENLNDSLVAPLFWFVLLGLPGAALYRFANTADALWGYRGRWEWAGKFAARADDLLNYIPARITGLLLCGLACPWKTLSREATKPPRPTAAGPWPAWPYAWACACPSLARTPCTPTDAFPPPMTCGPGCAGPPGSAGARGFWPA